MAPFGGDLPALVAQMALEPVGVPAGLAEDVEVEGVQRGVGLLAQLGEAPGDVAGDQIAAGVDAVRLVEPVPLLVVLVDELLGEGVRDGVGLGGVDVHREVAVPLLAGAEQGVEVGAAAGPFVVVAAVVGVGGVVALGLVALEEGELPQPVGGQRDALDGVEGGEKGVGGLAGEVERDVRDDPQMLFFGAQRPLHEVAQRDRAVLPVGGAVAVAVAGDDDGRVRQRVGGVHRLAGRPVGPLAAAQLGRDEAVAVHGLPPQSAVLPGGGARGSVVAGVGVDAGGQLAGGDDGVGASGRGGLGGGVVGDPYQGVAAGGLVEGDPGGEQGGAGLVAADGEQGEAGDVQGADAQCRGVGDAGDPPGGPPAVDGDLDGDAGAGVEAEGVGGAAGAGAVGDPGVWAVPSMRTSATGVCPPCSTAPVPRSV